MSETQPQPIPEGVAAAIREAWARGVPAAEIARVAQLTPAGWADIAERLQLDDRDAGRRPIGGRFGAVDGVRLAPRVLPPLDPDLTSH